MKQSKNMLKTYSLTLCFLKVFYLFDSATGLTELSKKTRRYTFNQWIKPIGNRLVVPWKI
jgi:hypothetical protein